MLVPVLSDGLLLLIALGGLATTVLSVLFVAGFFSTTKTVAHEEDHTEETVRGEARGALAALRRRKDRRKRTAEQGQGTAPDVDAPAPARNDVAETAARDENEGPVEPKMMTKKELHKAQRRREREELREWDHQQRLARQRLAEEQERAYQMKRQEEAKLEQAMEEEERKLQQERERKEQEELEQWKDMFTIEEQGTQVTEDSEASQLLLQEFVDYIKLHKVVLLEDLAAEFQMATKDTIDRVQSLQRSNRLTGIMDDRGKFIYITEAEMDKVAHFIQRRGRLGFAELAKECNKLIQLRGGAGNDPTSSLDWLHGDDAWNKKP
ncbi:hypothetical protein PsorP6_006644 [Peronosclerospora sorghi]|uniref:Uncharacterized protein n=1 Tax=Peronosclerospora sorghi TaxID=230839 RepID=A0ACC0W7Q5_9STRA|nr:hypothetical protein PsorP6_006644 [Peronosclerospora sorghi]